LPCKLSQLPTTPVTRLLLLSSKVEVVVEEEESVEEGGKNALVAEDAFAVDAVDLAVLEEGLAVVFDGDLLEDFSGDDDDVVESVEDDDGSLAVKSVTTWSLVRLVRRRLDDLSKTADGCFIEDAKDNVEKAATISTERKASWRRRVVATYSNNPRSISLVRLGILEGLKYRFIREQNCRFC
jgi:hypothetical protein